MHYSNQFHPLSEQLANTWTQYFIRVCRGQNLQAFEEVLGSILELAYHENIVLTDDELIKVADQYFDRHEDQLLRMARHASARDRAKKEANELAEED